LGLGIQAGLLHYQLTDNLQFDSQYSSQVGFDPSLDNGEKFKNSTLNKLDGGFGCILENTGYSWKPRFSISMNQLFAAKDVFSTASELQNFGIIQSSLEVRKAIGSKIEFTPYLMLSKQNQAKDVQLGSRISYALPKEQEIQLGMGLRSKDAFCSYIAYGFKSNLLGLSYDANRSNLRPASKGIGAWELSLRICFDKKKKDTNAKIDTLADSTLLAIDTVQIDSIQPEKVAIESPDSSKKTTPTDSLERPTNIVQTPLNPIDKAQDNSKAIEYSSINPNQIKNRLFVYFDHDMSILKSDYKIFLDNFVQQKEYTVLVSGHTDSDGDSMYNIYLGQSRAQEVLKYLVEQGVSVEHIRTFTYGKTNPITDNSDEQHKALNRRVEILLVVK
jgi:outer membrane protein OmpA-like peptidoglycan-associated protein